MSLCFCQITKVSLHPLSCLVEKGVLSVVLHAVGDDEVEVVLELLQAPVLMSIDAFPHGGEVHGVPDVVQVVRNLQGRKETCWRLSIVQGDDLQGIKKVL